MRFDVMRAPLERRPTLPAPELTTLIAQIDTEPDRSRLVEARPGAQRKSAAYEARRAAEDAALAVMQPELAALAAAGKIAGYELVPGVGALLVRVRTDGIAPALDALRGVTQLGDVTPNRVLHASRELERPGPLRSVVAGDSGPPATRPGEPEYNVAMLGAPALWERGIRGEGVTIGVLDSGVDADHAALRGAYRGRQADGSVSNDHNWFDAVEGTLEPFDATGHGSHVTATAVGGDPEHTIGVAPAAKFISARIMDFRGDTDLATILAGLSWMLAPTDVHGQNPEPTRAPDIVSASWGVALGEHPPELRRAFQALEDAGIAAVVAAGNAGPGPGTIGEPGAYDTALTVGASDWADRIATFSSRGTPGDPGRKPDVVAPGVDIVSARPGDDHAQYSQRSGSSMATPAVAGVLALLKSRHPELTPAQLRDAVRGSAVDLGPVGFDPDSGNGRVDALAAIELLSGGEG